MSNVEIERRGAVAIVRLNRPDRGNALDGRLPAELRTVVEELGRDSTVRGIVLTGAGRLFCAGGDIETLFEWRELDVDGRTDKYRGSQTLVTALQSSPVHVVAAINGPAAGAGVDIALACDLRVATPGASFTAAFASVGLVPDLGGSWFLARRLKTLDSLRFLLGGRRLSAADTVELGLVDCIAEDDELLSTACALIDELTTNVPRPVLTETLFAIRGAAQHDLDTSMGLAARAQATLMSTEEHEERISAFLTNTR